jgi:hypothetical protein
MWRQPSFYGHKCGDKKNFVRLDWFKYILLKIDGSKETKLDLAGLISRMFFNSTNSDAVNNPCYAIGTNDKKLFYC